MNENIPPIGHNLPTPISTLRQEIEEAEALLLKRRDELLAAVGRVPAAVESEEVAGKVGDLIKLLMTCHKAAETARVGRKEPFLEAGRAVDGFYKAITEPLTLAKIAIERRLTAYQRAKADAERRIREEAERVSREAAATAAEAARQAEAAMRNQADLDAAVEAANKATRAWADVVAAERNANLKAADLSRSRGELGSVASLHTFWDFRELDRSKLDLETLRSHLPIDSLEAAIRSFIKAGGRRLDGTVIFENTKTHVR